MPNLPQFDRPGLKTVFIQELRWWAVGAIFSFFLASILLTGWPHGLRPNTEYPFLYSGDALSHLWVIQRAIEGWIYNNHRSGFPFGSSLLDYPMSDATHLLLLKSLGHATGYSYVAFNIFVLISFSVSFVAAYIALRLIGLVIPLATSGAFLYAFLPFPFFRVGHVFYLSTFVAPVFFSIAVVLFMMRNESFLSHPLRNRFLFLLVILIALAGVGAYFSLFGVILFSTTALMVGLKTSKFWKMAPLMCAASALCIGVIINITPNVFYQFSNGENNEVANRSPVEAEVYGLKAIQLVLPRLGHRIMAWNNIAKHYSDLAPLVNENHTASLGVVGSLGLLFIGGIIIGSLAGRKYNDTILVIACITLVLFLFGTIGGLGSMFALAISPLIRGWNRLSVFIGFGSIAVFFIILQAFVTRVASKPWQRLAIIACAALVGGLGLLDQTASADTERNELTRKEFLLDKSFIEGIEQSVPPGTAIYQLPYMGFPEVPNLPSGFASYSLLTPLLHSKTLRWSHGGMKGRDGDQVFKLLSQEPLAKRIKIIQALGFNGIYIDVRGFEDGGAQILSELTSIVGVEPSIKRNDSKIVFFSLPRTETQLPQGLSEEELATWALRTWQFDLMPIDQEVPSDSGILSFIDWHSSEATHRWSNGNDCSIAFKLAKKDATARQLFVRGWSLGRQHLTLWLNEKIIYSAELNGIEQTLSIELPIGLLKAGTNVLKFELPDARLPDNGDPRVLAFALQSLKIQ
jgi:phosphoglycerol transferase